MERIALITLMVAGSVRCWQTETFPCTLAWPKASPECPARFSPMRLFILMLMATALLCGANANNLAR
ncbi:MAG: hypothetical protein KIT83_21895, partial [Bryobacterales bacterium]|nr:hypothetical protein [Bryobacterales bacterium]